MGRTIQEIQKQWELDRELHKYRQIPGYSEYEVTRYGEVRKVSTQKIVRSYSNGKHSYIKITSDLGRSLQLRVDDVVRMTYKGGVEDPYLNPEFA